MAYRPSFGEQNHGTLLRVQAKLSSAILGAVIVGAVLGCWSSLAGFFLFILGLLALPIALLSLGLVTCASIVSRRPEHTPIQQRLMPAAAALLLTTCSVLLLLPSLWLGIFLGNETLLLAYHREYRVIIDASAKLPAAPGTSSAYMERGSITYVVDYGTPHRIAFEPSGMLDNWSGIVWDPTGEVARARGFDPVSSRFYAPERITKLFGGDLVSCRRLWPEWYDCSFT